MQKLRKLGTGQGKNWAPPVTLSSYLDGFDPQPYHPAVQATETNPLAELERVVAENALRWIPAHSCSWPRK